MMLSRAIRRPWPHYLVHKVAPLVWRYVLWGALTSLALAALHAPFKSAMIGRVFVSLVVEPPAMLLVLCALALSFLAARLVRGLPVLVVLPFAALLEIAHLKWGGPIPASFCRSFVYLYVGHVFATDIRALARWASLHRETALAGLVMS